MPDVFISHSLADRTAASRLARALRARGLSVYRGPGLLDFARPGERVVSDVFEAFDEAHAVIVLFSHRAAGRSWLAHEAAMAAFQGKLIALSLDAGATPETLEAHLFEGVGAGELAPRFGLFGPARGIEALDALAAEVRVRQDGAQAARAQALARLQSEPGPDEGAAETIARDLRFELGASPGAIDTETRRTAYVSSLKAMEGASNPELRMAAQAYVRAHGAPEGLARLYAAAMRERQPLVWRRFGEVALPQAVYAAIAALERAGLSPRQIDERIAPQTRGALMRARFGDRMLDAAGVVGFVGVAALVALLGFQLAPGPQAPSTSASIPPLETAMADAAGEGAFAPTTPRRPPVPTPPQRPPLRAGPAPPLEQTSAAAAPASTLRPTGPSAAALAAPPPGARPGPCPSGPLTGAAVITVEPGDTLSGIARACYGEARAWRQVALCNPMLEQRNLSGVSPLFGGDLLYVGDRLVLPAPDGPCPTPL